MAVSRIIRPYIKDAYPSIEGNDRQFFDEQFTAIESTLQSIVEALSTKYIQGQIIDGAVTFNPSSHPIRILEANTESDASTDDLDTVNGGLEGQLLIIKALDSDRTVVVKDGTGNLKLSGDCTLDNIEDSITLYNKGGTEWRELARSNNAA